MVSVTTIDVAGNVADETSMVSLVVWLRHILVCRYCGAVIAKFVSHFQLSYSLRASLLSY